MRVERFQAVGRVGEYLMHSSHRGIWINPTLLPDIHAVSTNAQRSRMASGISTVVVAGNITRDPEQVSERLLTFTVAVSRREKDRDGEWTDVGHYFDVKVLGKPGIAAYATKGSGVTVLGDLVQERWENAEGEKRSAVRIIAREVVLGGSKGEGQPAKSDDETGW